MKKNIIILLVFISTNMLWGQLPPSIDHSFGDYTVAVNKIISKSITSYNLYSLNVPDPHCWGGPASLNSANGFENCDAPYTLCTSDYCPNDYYDFIEKAANLNASMFYRTAHTFFREDSFADNPPSGSLTEAYAIAMSQVVTDINNVYAQKGLRNPVIQGGCMERVGNRVNSVEIPRYIIDEFTDYMTQDEKDFYENTNPINFDKDRIYNCPGGMGCHKHYDITSIETQMWMYHVCRKYIDWGYTAIHMGIYWSYARNDANYVITERLYNMIRQYASENNSFVLLNGESPVTGGEAIGPSGRRLFDFDGHALRAREIADKNNDADFCGPTPIDPVMEAFFESGDCINELQPAIVDECSVGALSIDQETAWNGFYHEFGIPYTIYFDWSQGERVIQESNVPVCFPDPAHPNDPHYQIAHWDPNNIVGEPSNESVWGVDDVNWFAYLLDNEDVEDPMTLISGQDSDLCKGAWWEFSYSQIRKFEDKFGFLQAMGLHSVNRPSLHCNIPFNNYLNQMIPEPSYQEYKPITNYWFRIMNYGNTLDAYKEAWSVTDIKFNYTRERTNELIGCCDWFNGDKIQKLAYDHTITVLNPDPSSTYSIHVLNLTDNTWLPYTIGTEKVFRIPEVGDGDLFRIFVRSDNWISEYGQNGFNQEVKDYRLLSGSCFYKSCTAEPEPPKDPRRKLTHFKKIEANTNSSLKKYYSSIAELENVDFIPKEENIQEDEISMQIYPNPASKTKEFRLSLSKNIHENDILKIYSINGIDLTSSFEINKAAKKDLSISCVNSPPSGIYTVSYFHSGTKTFINQRLIIE